MQQDAINAIMRDSVDRFWQRFFVYCGCYGLAAYYYDILTAILCFTINILAEVFDYLLCRRLLTNTRTDEATLRTKRNWIVYSALQSATLITFASYLVAASNPIAFQILPLFFVFAAAIYAVLNLHPIPAAMAAHLVLYGIGMLFIAGRQLVIDTPPVDSHLWLQFIMVFFIYFIVIDCAIHFRRHYVERTERIKELRIARNEARTATANKDAMAAALTHDLRTPLNAMLVSAQLLELSELDAGQKQYAQTVVSSGWYLNRLLTDILDAEQLATGEMSISPVEADLHAVLHEVVALHSERAKEKGLEFSVMIAPDLPAAAMFDPVRIKQALNNLLSNAIKFTHHGSVSVHARSSGETMIISVVDTGPGIAEADIEKAFGRFSQIPANSGGTEKGSGLGLWISRALLRLMKGDLTLESTIEKGSTFTMSFHAEHAAPERIAS